MLHGYRLHISLINYFCCALTKTFNIDGTFNFHATNDANRVSAVTSQAPDPEPLCAIFFQPSCQTNNSQIDAALCCLTAVFPKKKKRWKRINHRKLFSVPIQTDKFVELVSINDNTNCEIETNYGIYKCSTDDLQNTNRNNKVRQTRSCASGNCE